MHDIKEGPGFALLKWNGKYGGDAKFCVRNNASGQQAILTPGRVHDLIWTRSNLVESPEIAEWSDFGEENVQDLDDVIM
jgi:hypothetical protein